MCAARKQELPPAGGYEKIVYERNPGRVLFKGRHILAGGLALQLGSLYLYHLHHQEAIKNRIERQGGHNAIEPFLAAERDRAYLKRLHYNRQVEEELMKDVEKWEVGTYYGEPIYRTINSHEKWVNPEFEELYTGVSTSSWTYRAARRFYC